MTFFKWKAAGASRRNSRLWMIRLKKFGLAFAFLSALSALAAYGWTGGFFSRTGDIVIGKTLSFTAALGFRVNEILVTGRDNIPQEELLTHLGIERNAPIFGVSLTQAQKDISEISWVKNVRVARRLPGEILVEIEERTPVALWQHQKKILAIDAEGKVLSGEGLGRYKSLPLVVGEGAPERVTEIITLLRAEPAISAVLSSAVRVGGRRWDLRLKNGITVKLPENDIELALSKLAAAQQNKGILSKNIDGIDLRLPEKMVVSQRTAPEQGKTNI